MRRTARLAVTTALAAAPLLGLAAPAALVAPAAAATTTMDSVRLNGFEARLVTQINDARRSAGLRALQVVPGTTDVARRWSWRMADAMNLWHNPSIISDLEHAGSGAWGNIAENVGYGPAGQPHTLFEAYMHSPEHRANILDHTVRYLGVGVVERDGTAFNTLDFTDAYSTSYGGTRVPAAGLAMDEWAITATTDVAMFESHTDQRVVSQGAGSVHARRIAFTGPSGRNDSAYTVMRSPPAAARATAPSSCATPWTSASATGLSLQMAAHDPRHNAVTAKILLRRSFGSTVRVGKVSVPRHGRWLHLALPDSARSYRDVLVVKLSARSVRGAGGRVRLDVFDVRATTG